MWGSAGGGLAPSVGLPFALFPKVCVGEGHGVCVLVYERAGGDDVGVGGGGLLFWVGWWLLILSGGLNLLFAKLFAFL